MNKKFELGEDVILALRDIISINDDCQGSPVSVKKRESEERQKLVQNWKEQALGGEDDETESD